jgi:hypothetical protein
MCVHHSQVVTSSSMVITSCYVSISVPNKACVHHNGASATYTKTPLSTEIYFNDFYECTFLFQSQQICWSHHTLQAREVSAPIPDRTTPVSCSATTEMTTAFHSVMFLLGLTPHIRLSLTYWDHHRGLTPLPAARNDQTFKRRRKRKMRLKPTVAVLVLCNHQLVISAEVFSREWRESEGLILIVTQVHTLQYVTIQQRQKVQFFVYY